VLPKTALVARQRETVVALKKKNTTVLVHIPPVLLKIALVVKLIETVALEKAVAVATLVMLVPIPPVLLKIALVARHAVVEVKVEAQEVLEQLLPTLLRIELVARVVEDRITVAASNLCQERNRNPERWIAIQTKSKSPTQTFLLALVEIWKLKLVPLMKTQTGRKSNENLKLKGSIKKAMLLLW
jgi:hypothetical protein